MNNLVEYLFDTHAVKVCMENSPFWYTSGKIGPYFINTHFLYGSEKDAVELLSFIDEKKSDKLALPRGVFEKVKTQYETNEIYKNVIDSVMNYLKTNINLEEVDYISGGERRDWFFSNIIAYLLNKPHITIYKDLSTVVSDSKFENTETISKLENKKVLHIADLMTIASSYIRAWIPAIENLGSSIVWSFAVVDRMQGGVENLKAHGIAAHSIIQINSALFQEAFEKGIITKEQQQMVENFIQDPDGSMREFLVNHPEFLENSLNGDSKTQERAKLCVEQDLYGLK